MRRLLEIARRNEIRREANLPLLSIAKELRRMKQQESQKTREMMAEAQEQFHDIAAEVHAEKDAEPVASKNPTVG